MIIALEGISGSGKTTLINNLIAKHKDKKIIAVHHPKKESLVGASAIGLIAKGLHLEGGLLALQDIKDSFNTAKKNPENIYLWSRCQLSTLVYNAQNLADRKILISAIEKDSCYPDYLFCLNVPTQVCYQRVVTRHREGDGYHELDLLRKKTLEYEKNKSYFENKIPNFFESDFETTEMLIDFIINDSKIICNEHDPRDYG
jgi:thymidylate kinase